MASWISPFGPMTFTLSKIYQKLQLMKHKVLIFNLVQLFKNNESKNFIFIILIFFLNNTLIVSQLTLHFFDFKYILNNSDAGKKAQTFLKNKLEKGIKIKKKEKKLQEEEKNYSAKKISIS